MYEKFLKLVVFTLLLFDVIQSHSFNFKYKTKENGEMPTKNIDSKIYTELLLNHNKTYLYEISFENSDIITCSSQEGSIEETINTPTNHIPIRISSLKDTTPICQDLISNYSLTGKLGLDFIESKSENSLYNSLIFSKYLNIKLNEKSLEGNIEISSNKPKSKPNAIYNIEKSSTSFRIKNIMSDIRFPNGRSMWSRNFAPDLDITFNDIFTKMPGHFVILRELHQQGNFKDHCKVHYINGNGYYYCEKSILSQSNLPPILFTFKNSLTFSIDIKECFLDAEKYLGEKFKDKLLLSFVHLNRQTSQVENKPYLSLGYGILKAFDFSIDLNEKTISFYWKKESNVKKFFLYLLIFIILGLTGFLLYRYCDLSSKRKRGNIENSKIEKEDENIIGDELLEKSEKGQ